MSNFNEYFKNQGAKIIVSRFFSRCDSYHPTAKISSLDCEVLEDSPQPASYYIENGLTATHKVRINYTLNDDDSTILCSEFEVPKEIDGAFIIEGAYRISTNRLSSDYDCRIRMSGTGEYIINFDYERRYEIKKKVLHVKINDPETGVAGRPVDVPYEEIDTLSGDKKEKYLKLSERQGKKFQIKLDLDYRPEYITTQLINECLAFGDDRLKDLVIDKTVESVPSGFMQFMFKSANGKNYISARRRIASYFTKYGKLQDQITAITTLAFRFFKGTQEAKAGETNIQVPPGVNAINLESLGSKITIPKTTAYNTTFADLIDFADTPINQNTNIQNSLTVSTRITDTDILFKAYTKDFKVVELPYIDYLNAKVCSSEFVDYKKHEVKPNENGEVEIKYRMKRKMVPVGEIELIDLHPDYRLSEVTRRIPFINSTDSVRISMGTSMLKQSVPLVNAQRPLVDTGNSDELNDNILNEKFAFDSGVVKGIDEEKVTIGLPDGTETNILRRTAIQSINNVSVYTEPKVKVGQKVTKGDIITGAVGLNKETYKPGLNALVLFHAYHGLVNEDALVISESFANRLASYSIIDLSIPVKHSSAIKWLAPAGTRVKSGDSVVTLAKGVKLDEINKALNDKLGGIYGGDFSEFMTVEENLKIPNNIDEAYVSDILVQEIKKPIIPKSVKAPDYTYSHTSEKVIEEYKKTETRKAVYDKFPEYIAADRLRPIELDRHDYKTVYVVRVRIIKRTIGMVGSKITNRFGGKGVVSKVQPDEMMPIMVDKASGKQFRVEVVMNPYSTINRKIAGVLLESSLGLVAHRLRDTVDEYKQTKAGQKKIKPLLEKYYPGRFDGMSVEEIIELHETKPIEEVYYFNVGCFSDFTPDLVSQWMEELGIESQSEILMPEEELTDLRELEENLSPEEYQKVLEGLKGKFRPVDRKLQCGWLTLEELYHIPSYSAKVTTSMYGSDVNFRRDQPIMGRGIYRQTGQKIGEMELSVLLSRNAKEYVGEARKATTKEDNQLFLNNLLGLGLTVVNDSGYNQGGSSLREELGKMKTKFRLKNQK